MIREYETNVKYLSPIVASKYQQIFYPLMPNTNKQQPLRHWIFYR